MHLRGSTAAKPGAGMPAPGADSAVPLATSGVIPLPIAETVAAALADVSRAHWHRVRAADKSGPQRIRLGRALHCRRGSRRLALRLVERRGGNLCYCNPRKRQLVWGDQRRHVDDSGEAMRPAKDTIQATERRRGIVAKRTGQPERRQGGRQ
jgi:hypothetical protein